MTSDVGGIHLPESLYGPCRFSIQYSVMVIRGSGVTLRTQKVIQDDYVTTNTPVTKSQSHAGTES